jgi:uncharacterized protein
MAKPFFRGVSMVVLWTALLAVSAMMAAPEISTAADQNVTVQGYGGVPIAGTLVLPAGADAAHPAPALLFIQGSGATDRDGNQLPQFQTNLLSEMARILAEQGIASLRCDKRGLHANRATLPKAADQASAFFSWEAYTGDWQAAFDFLAAQPGIASSRVGILGHSEGGLLALDLPAAHAQRAETLILASAPGRPWGEMFRDQLIALLEQQHAPPEVRQAFLDADERIRAEIIKTGEVPRDVPPGLAVFYPPYLGRYLKSELALDPVVLAGKFTHPILVVNGAADVQVLASRDGARFASAFASRQDGSEVFMPAGVSHNLKTVKADHDPGVTGPLDASVRDKIVTYLKTHL